MSIRFILLALLAVPLAGCMLNPYASDFNCPETDNGKCVSVADAYNESRGMAVTGQGLGAGLYQDAYFGRMAGLLNEPETPLVVPPKVMRVLMLPYEGQDEELYLYRYAYIFTDRPRWILDDPLVKPRGER